MSYKTFFKIWLKYNMSIKNNFKDVIISFAPLLGSGILILNAGVESVTKVFLIFMSSMFLFLVMSVKIRLPKLLYIQPLSKDDRITYVKRAYWTRIAMVEAVYVCVSLVFYISHNISWFYFVCANIGNFIMLQSANNMSFFQLENMSQKNVSEMNSMVYGAGGQIAGMCAMTIGIFVVAFTWSADAWTCFCMGAVIFYGVIYFSWFYSRQYKRLMEMTSSYESYDRIRRAFSS